MNSDREPFDTEGYAYVGQLADDSQISITPTRTVRGRLTLFPGTDPIEGFLHLDSGDFVKFVSLDGNFVSMVRRDALPDDFLSVE